MTAKHESSMAILTHVHRAFDRGMLAEIDVPALDEDGRQNTYLSTANLLIASALAWT